MNDQSHNDDLNNNTEAKAQPSEPAVEVEQIKIEFPFSEIVREKVPGVFKAAETVATQWVNDQKFENIGLGHPLAEVAAIKALEKAKDVEKKLEEKGVVTATKMGFEIAKHQTQSLLSKLGFK